MKTARRLLFCFSLLNFVSCMTEYLPITFPDTHPSSPFAEEAEMYSPSSALELPQAIKTESFKSSSEMHHAK